MNINMFDDANLGVVDAEIGLEFINMIMSYFCSKNMV